MQVKVANVVLMEVIKHFKNTKASWETDTRCIGRIYGSIAEEVTISSAFPKEGRTTEKALMTQDDNCIGIYICGGNTEIRQKQLDEMIAIRTEKNIDRPVLLVVDTERSLSERALKLRAYTLKAGVESTTAVSEAFEEASIAVASSSLEKQFFANI